MPTATARKFAALVVLAVGVVGCQKVRDDRRAPESNDLKELGLAYLNFQDAEGRPPKSFEELNRKAKLSPGCAKATMFWGAGMAAMCKDGPTTDVVIGHITTSDGKAVQALMCDGSVRGMTAAEFESAKKAKPR